MNTWLNLSLVIALSTPLLGMNVPQVITRMHQAIQTKDTQTLKRLLDEGAHTEGSILGNQTPLHTAALTANLEAINLLLERKGNIEHRLYNGATMLHSAAASGSVPVAALILERLKKHNPEILETKTQEGVTPLYTAAFMGRPTMIIFLKNLGASIHKPDANGATPLHAAAIAKHTQAVEALLVSGAHINARDNSHSTPLHNAYISCADECIKLLEKEGADRQALNSHNVMPHECYGYALTHKPLN